MANLTQNQVVLPNDKNVVIDKIMAELSLLRNDIKEKKIGGAALEAAKRNESTLQSLIDKFLAKKGVITPQETNDTLSAIE
jgi:hypothetical protein